MCWPYGEYQHLLAGSKAVIVPCAMFGEALMHSLGDLLAYLPAREASVSLAVSSSVALLKEKQRDKTIIVTGVHHLCAKLPLLCKVVGSADRRAIGGKMEATLMRCEVITTVASSRLCRLKTCAHCGAERGPNGKLYHCEQCKSAGRSYYFCSRECMKEDWPVHKIVCSPNGLLP